MDTEVQHNKMNYKKCHSPNSSKIQLESSRERERGKIDTSTCKYMKAHFALYSYFNRKWQLVLWTQSPPLSELMWACMYVCV